MFPDMKPDLGKRLASSALGPAKQCVLQHDALGEHSIHVVSPRAIAQVNGRPQGDGCLDWSRRGHDVGGRAVHPVAVVLLLQRCLRGRTRFDHDWLRTRLDDQDVRLLFGCPGTHPYSRQCGPARSHAIEQSGYASVKLRF